MNIYCYDTGANPGDLNMALDEVLQDQPFPVLRFYTWKTRTITIGRFQSHREINLEAAEMDNVPVIRRETGGKGVLHGDDLTLSMILPADFVPLSVKEAASIAGSGMVRGLRLLGIKAQQVTERAGSFSSSYCFGVHFPWEVVVGKNKIAGIALRRFKQRVLYQISIPLFISTDLISKYFSQASKEPTALREGGGLKEYLGPEFSLHDVKAVLLREMSHSLGFQPSHVSLSSLHLDRAVSLAQSKYSSMEWTCSR